MGYIQKWHIPLPLTFCWLNSNRISTPNAKGSGTFSLSAYPGRRGNGFEDQPASFGHIS